MTRVGTPRRVVTSWRVVTSLCLIFFLIDLSKEGCSDYLKLDKWNGTDLIRTIPLAQNKDPKDLLHCTLQLACEMNDTWCPIRYDCFHPDNKTTCEGPSSRNISFYHLMCLVAKLQNYPPKGVVPEGCKYENVCELYPQISADQTTTKAPITEATTATSPTTVLSPTTTPAPPPTPPLTPAPPPTPGTTTVKHDGGNANSSTGTRDASNVLYIMLFMLIISGTLNLVQAVLFCKRWRTQHRTQNPTHQDESSVLNETCDDPDPLPLMPIITKPDCPHVDSPSADTTRNRCTAGNGLESH